MSNLDFMKDFKPSEAAKNASTGDFAPIPKGVYQLRVTSAEVVATKAGDGTMVKVRLDVEGPEHVGRVLFDQILVASRSAKEQAVEIGRAKFGQLCEACGFTDAPPSDTSALIGHLVECYVKIDPAKNGYEAQNRVTSYAKTGAAPLAGGSFADDDIPF